MYTLIQSLVPFSSLPKIKLDFCLLMAVAFLNVLFKKKKKGGGGVGVGVGPAF